jgi:hypothetical protein
VKELDEAGGKRDNSFMDKDMFHKEIIITSTIQGQQLPVDRCRETDLPDTTTITTLPILTNIDQSQ